MRHCIGIAMAMSLTACATHTPEPRIEVREVKVPVAVKCSPQLSPVPDYPDSDASLKEAPSTFDRVKLLVAGRLLRIAREAELNAAIKGCS